MFASSMKKSASRVGTKRDTDEFSRVLKIGGQTVCVGSVLMFLAVVLVKPNDAAFAISIALACNVVLGILAIVASQRRYLKTAVVLITLSVIFVTCVGVFGAGYGLKSGGFVLYVTLICAASLSFGSRAGWLATGGGLFLLYGAYALEKSGVVLAPHSDRQGTVLTSFAAMVLILIILFIITRSFLNRHAAARRELIAEAQALELAISRRQQAERESSEFFSSLSHAIRTPMVGIQGGLQLLKDSRIPAEKREHYLRSLRRSAQELESFVQSLLDFKASRRGLILTDLKPCDLRPFLADLCAQFKTSSAQKSLRWNFHIEGTTHAEVLVDEKRLHQVLSILLSNAVKYCRDGDSISLSAVPLDIDENAVAWSFTVRDTGPGIDADTLNRIFQPFIQNQAHGANQTSGTGMGLALAHELSLLMGGSLQVSSEIERGSRFWLVLPLQRVVRSGAA